MQSAPTAPMDVERVAPAADGFSAALAPWGLSAPLTLRPTSSGINNDTWYVDSPSGSYVLRRYQNTRDPGRVRYEHAVLKALRHQELPFGVPDPVPTLNGGTVVRQLNGTLAALFRVLPGAAADRGNLDHIRACGAALAALHSALRRVDVPPPPAGQVRYGDLDRISPRVPDPWSLADGLTLDAGTRERLRAALARARAEIPTLYAALPQQLCHNDYGPGNTLVADGRVTAILDFEFAGVDLRAIDVAAGWYWAVGPKWGSSAELAFYRAFVEGYVEATRPSREADRLTREPGRPTGEITRLTEAEIDAMPSLSRLVRVTSVVHWAGRHRAGLATETRLHEQVQRLLDLDIWLTQHEATLRSILRDASALP